MLSSSFFTILAEYLAHFFFHLVLKQLFLHDGLDFSSSFVVQKAGLTLESFFSFNFFS